MACRVAILPVAAASSASSASATSGRRLTTRYASKYEKARLLGEWATRVSNGEDPAIDLTQVPEKDRHLYCDPLVIAHLALKNKTMPLFVRRFLPDGSYEDWQLSELVFD